MALDVQQLCDVLFWRLGTWCQARWEEAKFSLSHFIADPSIFCPPKVAEIKRKGGKWCAPNLSCVKFNVDASICSESSIAGIGGLLRDHMGSVLLKFIKSLGVIDIGLAELLAVREALVIFRASQWFGHKVLIVETDCANVVKWLGKPDSAPASLRNVVSSTSKLGTEFKWHVRHVVRDLNKDADELAKVAAKRNDDTVVLG